MVLIGILRWLILHWSLLILVVFQISYCTVHLHFSFVLISWAIVGVGMIPPRGFTGYSLAYGRYADRQGWRWLLTTILMSFTLFIIQWMPSSRQSSSHPLASLSYTSLNFLSATDLYRLRTDLRVLETPAVFLAVVCALWGKHILTWLRRESRCPELSGASCPWRKSYCLWCALWY